MLQGNEKRSSISELEKWMDSIKDNILTGSTGYTGFFTVS
jgi:hypothetical protein